MQRRFLQPTLWIEPQISDLQKFFLVDFTKSIFWSIFGLGMVLNSLYFLFSASSCSKGFSCFAFAL